MAEVKDEKVNLNCALYHARLTVDEKRVVENQLVRWIAPYTARGSSDHEAVALKKILVAFQKTFDELQAYQTAFGDRVWAYTNGSIIEWDEKSSD